jgi:hypothetical protein
MKFQSLLENFFNLFLELFSLILLLIVLILLVIKNLAPIKILIFYFSFQGTVFLAGAFSVSIWQLVCNCNEISFWENIKKFRNNCQFESTVKFDPLLFLLGIIFLLLSSTFNALF